MPTRARVVSNHFSVAAPAVRSDDRENGERTSAQSSHTVAGYCGILAPLPGLDRRPPKPKCVNHFSKNLVSQLTRAHRLDAAGFPAEDINALGKLAEESRINYGYHDGEGGLQPEVPNAIVGWPN